MTSSQQEQREREQVSDPGEGDRGRPDLFSRPNRERVLQRYESRRGHTHTHTQTSPKVLSSYNISTYYIVLILMPLGDR